MDAYEYLFDDDTDLLEALEAYEDGEAADRAMALYQAREEQREFQRNLIEQQGGSIDENQPGRFVFELEPLQRQTNRRYGIQERNYNVRLRQEGNIIDQLAPAIRDAMQRSVAEVLNNDNIPDNHRLFFDLFSNRLSAGTYRSNGMTVGDWRHNPERVDTIFENLQQTLNSNEDFAMNDTFHMEITTVAPVYRQVRGRRKRRTKVVYKGIDNFLANNKSIIKITNTEDNYCAARAISAVKGDLDYPARHPMRERLMKNRRTTADKTQKEAAIALHQAAGVPLDCAVGADELAKFQSVLPNYQLVCIYTGRNHEAVAFSPYHKDKKIITIVHIDDHYHGCTSLTGYRQTAYVCKKCFKGYDKEGHHRCESTENKKFCLCCRREECPDFMECHPQNLKPKKKCGSCGRYFYGETCFENHLKYSAAGKVNPEDCICLNIRRCKKCKKLNRCKQDIKTHQCGFASCPTCKDYVLLEEHRCFIESAGKVRDKRRAAALAKKLNKRRKKAAAAAEADPDSDIEPVNLEEDLIAEWEQEEELMAEQEGVAPRNPQSESPKENKPPIHVFFDIEARQESGTHEANLLIYQDDLGNEVTLWGDNCVEAFIKDLKELTERKQRRIIVIAHNLQAYDGYFIIKEMYRDGKQLTQIRNGAKILELEHFDIRFIDSLNFFAMPLKAFPSTFGLSYVDNDGQEAHYAKGYFPHLFNRRENEDYVGLLPPKSYYLPEAMSVDDLKKFETWYEEQTKNDAIFDFKRDIKSYCQMDVTILREGCQTFQRLFQKETEIVDENGKKIPGFNPFDHITIASACNRDMINRTEDETIASEPPYGWAGLRGNQSKQALEWLLWTQHCKREDYTEEQYQNDEAMKVPYHEREYFIQHSGNGGERTIQYVGQVDGFCQATNTVYEFQGCFWHGCETCFPNRTERHTRLDNRQMWEVREVTKEKIAKLKSCYYNVVEMWGCQWEEFKKKNQDCATFVKNLELKERMNPREAFFGGRTNAAKLHHQCADGETIQYYDFTSLYPFCNKYSLYPTGHPEVLFNPTDQDIHSYFGIAQCIVRPPKELYHPVLPVRVNGKLLFPLCVACASEQLDRPLLERSCACPHSDVEREMLGTWCTPELEEAVAQGYDIVKIIEVYHFPEEQRRKGLFAPYIDKWYRIKTEASGWPAWCTDDTKKTKFLEDFKKREGIELSAHELNKGSNPGLRSLAKLMLNSMWGKFGQRPNKTQCCHFTDPQEFHEFLESDRYVIQKIQLLPDRQDPSQIDEHAIDVFYTLRSEDQEINGKCNIFIAAFTTCWARLKLYEELKRGQEQILYYDTDSILLVIDENNPHHYQPTTGDYLGDLTNELWDKKKKEFRTIQEFSSAGPKNYGYVLDNGKQECKVKGFSLNVEGSKQLNYSILRNNVISEIQDPQVINGQVVRRKYPIKRSHKIVRDVKQLELKTVEETKNYQLVFDKRVVDPETFATYPYGYGELDTDGMELDINTLLDL